MSDLLMTQHEHVRLHIIEQVMARHLMQGAAAARLSLSSHQTKRLVRAYKLSGPAALVTIRSSLELDQELLANEREPPHADVMILSRMTANN